MRTVILTSTFLSSVSAAGLVVAALTLSACGAAPAKAPSGDTGSGTTNSSQANALGDLDPCTTLSSGEAAQLGAEGPGTRRDVAGSQGCRWDTPEGLLAVSLHPDRALDKLNVSGEQVEDTSLNGRKAKLVRPNEQDGSCELLVEVTASTSAGISGTTDDMNNETACQLAQKAAPFVEAKLPR